MAENSKFLPQINQYYTQKILEYGPTAKGVDWNGDDSQMMRFIQLAKLLPTHDFEVLDFGCGYGSLLDFLKKKNIDFNYTGFDISSEMLRNALMLHGDSVKVKWLKDEGDLTETDYVLASGLFNVKLGNTKMEWQEYCENILIRLNDLSKKGFGFNMLSRYSDLDFMKDYLYYADPLHFFDFCKTKFSKNIALLHDYDLHEFTILVRK